MPPPAGGREGRPYGIFPVEVRLIVDLRGRIEKLSAEGSEASPDAARLAVAELFAELSAGRGCAAGREGDTWLSRAWVKR